MTINIGIIGIGTVGSGTYSLLQKRIENISIRVGCDLKIKKVCDKREDVKKPLNIPSDIFTSDYKEVVNDGDISLVVELTGNVDFAYSLIMECFEQKKHVVTANKALLASKWKEIFGKARECGCLIYFEASVGSGIPVIQGINEGLAANRIDSIKGILNGTTNYVLTRMSRDGSAFDEAVRSAVEAGFAEPDSSADISGLDAAHKICVLANVVFGNPVEFNKVFRQGIEDVQLQDIKYAGEMFGFNLKLLSVIKRHANGVEVRVHPALLAADDMLAGVNYEYNGILVEGDAAGKVMFYGRGAGSSAAASAVVSDIIYLAQKINYGYAGNIPYVHTDCGSSTPVLNIDDMVFQYYVRFTTEDKPGVLSNISGILGNNEVSIASCFQKGRSEQKEVPIVMVTHKAREGNLKKALEEIDKLDFVKKKSVFLRIESDDELG